MNRRCWLLLLAAAVACSQNIQLAAEHDAAAPSMSVRDASARTAQLDAAVTPAAPSGSRDAYCAGHGPPAELDWPAPTATAAAQSCEHGRPTHVFRYALCSCNNANVVGAFATDAFDANDGAYRPGQSGASIGLDQLLFSAGSFDIAGSLIVAGSVGWSIAGVGPNRVVGNLRTNAEVAINAATEFGRDVWAKGNITVIGQARVNGDVYQVPGRAQPAGVSVGGRWIAKEFDVAQPCACGDAEILDVASVVAAAKNSVHNAAVGVSNSALNSQGLGGLELRCGRYLFNGGFLDAAASLSVRGRTVLYIDGNLTIFGRFATELATQGELDVFVNGALFIGGVAQIGDKRKPSALRIYSTGYGSVAINPASTFAANLYAPHTLVAVAGINDVFGALFVWAYSTGGDNRIHYDRAILELDADDKTCVQPTPAGGCSSDEQCDPPQICNGGSCTLAALQRRQDARAA